MKTSFHIASYDKKSDAQIETFEVDAKYFDVLREVLGERFNPYQDCYLITEDVAKEYQRRFKAKLNSKVEYYLERFVV